VTVFRCEPVVVDGAVRFRIAKNLQQPIAAATCWSSRNHREARRLTGDRIRLDDQGVHDITGESVVVRGDVECARERITLAIQRVESLNFFPTKSCIESSGTSSRLDDQSIGTKSARILGAVAN